MALTVLTVAYPFAPVGPDAVGGAEQIASALDEALVRAGWRSLVLAVDGSTVAGELIALPRPRGPIDGGAKAGVHARIRTALRRALDEHPVDLVHMHGVDFHAYLPPPGVPVLATLHLPLSFYPPEALKPQRPGTWLLGVSASQTRTAPDGVRLLPPIENGAPVDRLALRVDKRRFAMAMGRVCPEKGFHIALDAARKRDVQCLLAGRVDPYPEHEAYFEAEVKPRLDGRRRFLGPIGFSRKRWMLASARCLLVPSLVAETSSLVAMEALAAGAPVVAFPNGALADLVDHGVTGFLVKDADEMAEAIDACERIDPDACRAQAQSRHTLERMVGRYLDLYAELARAPASQAGAA